ncbi:MAG TPA: beta-propeller domain-containing protein [Polyangia bacterium]|nr:beta-propeller domain-containing protein [Polyangia bacterium]
MTLKANRNHLALIVGAALLGLGGAACDGGGQSPLTPGQTTFETDDPVGGGRQLTPGANAGAADSAGKGATTAQPGAPSGRTGTVEEADIYRIDGNRMFYFNTYRGFLVYDLTDPKHPQRVSRLPVYGYPVEMFVQGNTVYALLRDALYLTETAGQVRFERHDVSQLISIDVTDPAHPQVLKTIDIVGQLREGVSRKIDDTIYVVSYVPQGYYWGWRYELTSPQTEQAWVYSFNVADPKNLVEVQRLKVFEGGSINAEDPVTGGQVSRTFSDVAISATSNALMVVENWYISSWTPATNTKTGVYDCGSYSGDQRAVVSVIDVSDPTGVIRLHTRFQTRGSLGDQFKQTYVYDDATATGTYYGIFARQAWQSSGCSGQQFVQNDLEAWDVTNGAAPKKLSSLDFGKPNETVRGTAYDVSRKVAYAVTAQQIDPLYVFDLSNRAQLKIRSQIDGLSGDMTLFRTVEGGKYLMGIGRDASETCSGFQGTETRHGIGVAVSLIDVRNLDAIKLMQRQCVAVDGDWVSSEVTWNLDQAHKLIGMESDATANVITIPVSYAKRINDVNDANAWWWYRQETAVGIMAWDVSAYDPAKAPADQTVIKNYGTFVHPNGEVRRSIVFPHATTGHRTMVNLSDTHVSVADIQDLAHPALQSIVEIAPYVGQIYQFGAYVVEQVTNAQYPWAPSQGETEFRVKLAGGELESAPVVASFTVAQAQSVVPFGDKLVVFRYEQPDPSATKTAVDPYQNRTRALVFDLSNPTTPRLAGSTLVPGYFYAYYPFFCGVDGGYWYWWGGNNQWTKTARGLVALEWTYDATTQTSGVALKTIDLTDATHPAVNITNVPAAKDRGYLALVPDGVDSTGFYLTYADVISRQQTNSVYLTRSRYFAERWAPDGAGGWQSQGAVNLPGQLVRTWAPTAGTRALLTSDTVNYETRDDQNIVYWRSDTRLNLLRGITTPTGAAAELTASQRFQGKYVSDFVTEGSTLFVNVGTGYGYGYYGGGVAIGGKGVAVPTVSGLASDDTSDHLTIYDVSKLTFNPLYDQPTGTTGAQFMGVYQHQLFVNLSGDGLFAVDVSDPAHPFGREFLRTLGWGTHVAFVGNSAYVASGYFGVYRMPLTPVATP